VPTDDQARASEYKAAPSLRRAPSKWNDDHGVIMASDSGCHPITHTRTHTHPHTLAHTHALTGPTRSHPPPSQVHHNWSGGSGWMLLSGGGGYRIRYRATVCALRSRARWREHYCIAWWQCRSVSLLRGLFFSKKRERDSGERARADRLRF
jgi:hypothetical protein